MFEFIPCTSEGISAEKDGLNRSCSSHFDLLSKPTMFDPGSMLSQQDLFACHAKSKLVFQ